VDGRETLVLAIRCRRIALPGHDGGAWGLDYRLDVRIGVARFPPLRVRFQRTISQKIPTTATKPMVKIRVRTNGQPRAKTMA
jgi:hypothetical protein